MFATAAEASAEPDLSMHARHPLGATGRRGNRFDRGMQRSVDEGASGGTALPLLVAARGGDVQHPAGHRDVHAVGGKLLDQPELHFGGTFSRAKNAAGDSTGQRNSASSLAAGVS